MKNRRKTIKCMVALALMALFAIGESAKTQTAQAAPGEVLILDTSVSGGLSSLEAAKVVAAGRTPIVVDAAT